MPFTLQAGQFLLCIKETSVKDMKRCFTWGETCKDSVLRRTLCSISERVRKPEIDVLKRMLRKIGSCSMLLMDVYTALVFSAHQESVCKFIESLTRNIPSCQLLNLEMSDPY